MHAWPVIGGRLATRARPAAASAVQCSPVHTYTYATTSCTSTTGHVSTRHNHCSLATCQTHETLFFPPLLSCPRPRTHSAPVPNVGYFVWLKRQWGEAASRESSSKTTQSSLSTFSVPPLKVVQPVFSHALNARGRACWHHAPSRRRKLDPSTQPRPGF